VFRKVNPAYADKLLSHAKQLFEFANKYRGFYSDSIPQAEEFYKKAIFLKIKLPFLGTKKEVLQLHG